MDKPWFKLNPNNFSDRWWLYTSIVNTKTAQIEKKDTDIICYFIIQDYNNNINSVFYRTSVWYRDDPNRYLIIDSDYTWKFNKKLRDIKKGDIVITGDEKFNAYNCNFCLPEQQEFCKILERIT